MLGITIPAFLGDFHPILLHYTIVFLTVAAVCDLIHNRWSLDTERIAYWCYVIGAIVCVPTIICGLAAAGNFDPHDSYLNYHRYLGFAMLAVASSQALYRAGVLKGLCSSHQVVLLVASTVMLVIMVLVGETGGILTRGKTPFMSRQRPAQQLSLGGSPPVPPSIGDTFAVVEPFLEKRVLFSHVDKIFRDRHCVDCHAEMGQPSYPLNMHENEAGSIDWLPSRDDLTAESIGFCQLYQAIVLDNRMPPPLDDENHAGLPLAERLLIIQYLKNLSSPSDPISDGNES